MYLPPKVLNARVLITVKTYPLPSGKYDELVCTAGILPDGKWIRIYPVPFRALSFDGQYKKYEWIELDLIRNSSDFRPESYRPVHGIDQIKIGEQVSTGKDRTWRERRKLVLKEVFSSMKELIAQAYSNEAKSLAVLKPSEIVGFEIKPDEREWKPKWREQLLQMNLFDWAETGEGKKRDVVRKLPYKYYYHFLTEGDSRPRKMMIEDWEIGALYWNCLQMTNGDEEEANKLVRKKYYDEFVNKKDLYLFLGTTLKFHRKRAPNPFVIIGVFYPPKDYQLAFDF